MGKRTNRTVVLVTTCALVAFAHAKQPREDATMLAAADAPSPASFGGAMALDDDVLAVGAVRANGDIRGACFVYERSGDGWTRVARLTVPDDEPSIGFGGAVDVQGDTLVVGGSRDWGLGGGGGNTTTPRVYTRTSSGWELAAVLDSGLETPTRACYGSAVALDGDRIVVGAYRDRRDPDGAFSDENRRGAAYVFERKGGEWTRSARLVPPVGSTTVFFARSLALDGDTLLVGAPYDSDHANHSGAVYVYLRDGAEWTLSQKITLRSSESSHFFGSSLALDGDRFLVSERDSDVVTDNGCVHVFARRDGVFERETRLEPRESGVRADFGSSVALDGDRALVGARGFSAHSGIVDAWRLTAAGWAHTSRICLFDEESSSEEGLACALSATEIVVGAPSADGAIGDRAGAVGLLDVDPHFATRVPLGGADPDMQRTVAGSLIPESARLTGGRRPRFIVKGTLNLGGIRPTGFAQVELTRNSATRLGPRKWVLNALERSGNGRVFTGSADGFSIRIKRQRADSSRASIRLISSETADPVHIGGGRMRRLDRDSRAYLNFQIDALDVREAVFLRKGKFKRSRTPELRSSVDPALRDLRLRARRGARDDARIRFTMPDAVRSTPDPKSVRVQVDGFLDVTFDGPFHSAPGVVSQDTTTEGGARRRLRLDRRRHELDVRVGRTELGALPRGAHDLTVRLTVDGLEYVLRAIASGNGRKLEY